MERLHKGKKMSKKSVAVLDIRSSEIAIFVGERGVNNTFVFRASKTEPYGGYQDGEFYDAAELSRAVHRALDAVEQICGEKFRALYVGVPGEFTLVVPKEQMVGFPKRTKIGAREIDALFDSGKEEREGYRAIRVTSMIYTTADNRRVADPTGLYSTGLSGVLSYFYCTEYFASVIEKIFEDTKIALHFLPTQLATACYLIPPETRDEYAFFLDVGFLSSTVCLVLGGGILAQYTYWVGQGQIAVRLMQKFGIPYEGAVQLLTRSNLYLKREAKSREFFFRGVNYEIPTDVFVEEVKAGLDEICEQVSGFLEECSGKELDMKPLYVTGEGLDGIRGALEHLSKRLNCVCEQLAPDLPYYNKPSMSSRIALTDMAYEDYRMSGKFFRLLNGFGG